MTCCLTSDKLKSNMKQITEKQWRIKLTIIEDKNVDRQVMKKMDSQLSYTQSLDTLTSKVWAKYSIIHFSLWEYLHNYFLEFALFMI